MKQKVISFLETLDFEREFLIDAHNNVRYSYAAFFTRCAGIADKLQKQAVENVFAIMENSADLFCLYFAVILAGKKILAADPEKGITELSALIDEAGEVCLISDKDGLISGLDIFGADSVSVAVDKATIIEAFQKYDFDGSYLTTFTSGTSGKTKGVVNSLNNLFRTTFAFEEKLEVPPTGTFLHLMPMTYMAGILNSIFMPFIMGYRVVIDSRFSVRLAMKFWKLVEQYEVNLLWMSPMMLTMVDKVDRSKHYEDYCREHKICFLIGTAPLALDLRKHFEARYGVTLQASYGLSETLFLSVETQQSIAKTTTDNVGELLTGVECRVQDDGELQVSVPWMFKGYTNVDTAEYFAGDYYITGDLVKITDGILYITGRKKELIIRGGMNISPKLIENCIMKTGLFTEYVVFGKTNDYGEEEVICAYTADSKAAADYKNIEKDVAAAVIKELGSNYAINGFRRMDKLPRNINGKIDKNELKKTKVGKINGK